MKCGYSFSQGEYLGELEENIRDAYRLMVEGGDVTSDYGAD